MGAYEQEAPARALLRIDRGTRRRCVLGSSNQGKIPAFISELKACGKARFLFGTRFLREFLLRLDSLDANALSLKNAARVFDLLDPGDPALVKIHLPDFHESGGLHVVNERVRVIHPLV